MKHKYDYIIDEIDTLRRFMEVDEMLFKDNVDSLGEEWEGFIPGISSGEIIDAMTKNGLENPITKGEKYKIEEKLYRNKINSSERISSFLNASPEEVLVFWNPNGMEEISDVDLIKRSMENYFEFNPWGNAEAKKNLGAPVENINFFEGPEGTRSYEHDIKMYQAKGGEKFVSWETYSEKWWMCSKSLMENLLLSSEN